MQPTVIGIAVLAFTFLGAVAGMKLRSVLPDHHLGSEARDAIKLGIGLVATVTALVLGLLTASAKSTYDSLDATVKHTAVDILALDRVLARYGAETAGIRAGIKRVLATKIDQIWSERGARSTHFDTAASFHGAEQLAGEIRKLVPQTEEQRALQARASTLAESIMDARWMIVAGIASSVPYAFLVVLLIWLTITFTTFGLLAPRNRTVVCLLFVCALSVAGAIFLILEMESPFDGLVTVSPNALRLALESINR